MMEDTKSLCAKIPSVLHAKVRTKQEESKLNLNQYIEEILTEYYKIKEGEKMSNTEIRTLAIQISAELMDRLDAHLEKNGIKKKAFLTNLIEKVLDEAELEKMENETN